MFKSMIVVAAMLWTTSAFAQKYAITGTVRDEQLKEVLVGATLEVKGTSHFAVTDSQGNFKIEDLLAGNYTVVFIFLGYAPKSEQVNVQSDVEMVINMESSAQLTEEVVVFATRANDKTPTTFTHVKKEVI